MDGINRRYKSRPGLWIAIYGPDGAGKSAVLKQLAFELAPIYSGLRAYHLRAPLISGSKATAPVTNPHSRRPRGNFLSCLKLLYMLADAWWTHLAVVLPCLVSGQVVFFDRYFLDYSIDPRRYRLPQTCTGLARALGRLAPQPDLQFVLDVPAAELQRRKKEVSLAESERQRSAYADVLGGLPNTVVIDADRPAPVVANEIAGVILATDGVQDRVPEASLAGL